MSNKTYEGDEVLDEEDIELMKRLSKPKYNFDDFEEYLKKKKTKMLDSIDWKKMTLKGQDNESI